METQVKKAEEVMGADKMEMERRKLLVNLDISNRGMLDAVLSRI